MRFINVKNKDQIFKLLGNGPKQTSIGCYFTRKPNEEDINIIVKWMNKHKCYIKKDTFYLLSGKLFNETLKDPINLTYHIIDYKYDEVIDLQNFNNKADIYEKYHAQEFMNKTAKDSGYCDDCVFLLIKLDNITNIKALETSAKNEIGLRWFGDIYINALERMYNGYLPTQEIF